MSPLPQPAFSLVWVWFRYPLLLYIHGRMQQPRHVPKTTFYHTPSHPSTLCSFLSSVIFCESWVDEVIQMSHLGMITEQLLVLSTMTSPQSLTTSSRSLSNQDCWQHISRVYIYLKANLTLCPFSIVSYHLVARLHIQPMNSPVMVLTMFSVPGAFLLWIWPKIQSERSWLSHGSSATVAPATGLAWPFVYCGMQSSQLDKTTDNFPVPIPASLGTTESQSAGMKLPTQLHLDFSVSRTENM